MRWRSENRYNVFNLAGQDDGHLVSVPVALYDSITHRYAGRDGQHWKSRCEVLALNARFARLCVGTMH